MRDELKQAMEDLSIRDYEFKTTGFGMIRDLDDYSSAATLGQVPWRDIPESLLLNTIAKVFQSNTQRTLMELQLTLSIHARRIGATRGFDDPDQLCGFRAFIKQMMQREHTHDRKILREGVQKLHRLLGSPEGLSVSDCAKLVLVHKDIRIIVLRRNVRGILDWAKNEIYSGTEWKENDYFAPQNVIIMVLDEVKQHWETINFRERSLYMRQALGYRSNNGECAICYHCCTAMLKSKRFGRQERTNHVCGRNNYCISCKETFIDPNEFHTHIRQGSKVCSWCSTLCFGEQCLIKHKSTCLARYLDPVEKTGDRYEVEHSQGTLGQGRTSRESVMCGLCGKGHRNYSTDTNGVRQPAGDCNATIFCSMCYSKRTNKGEITEEMRFITVEQACNGAHQHFIESKKFQPMLVDSEELEPESDEEDSISVSHHRKGISKKVPISFAWDIETMKTPATNGAHAFSTNLICLTQFGINPLELDEYSPLAEKEYVFKGEFALHEMLEFCRFKSEPMNGNWRITLWAHNGAKFDSVEIYNELCRDPAFTHKINPIKTIMAGNKIMKFVIDGIATFMDSYLHLTSPLSGLPKMFGVKASKGHFPHEFNIPEHQDYKGALPALEYYDPEGSKSGGKYNLPWEPKTLPGFELRQWHAEEKLKWWSEEDPTKPKWDMQAELLRYCLMDTRILAQCLTLYNELGFKTFEIYPLDSATSPSFALKAFKKLLDPSLRIPVLPKFTSERKRSKAPLDQRYFADMDGLAREGYFGGDTAFARTKFESSTWEENGVQYRDIVDCDDIKSSYPTQMAMLDYPEGRYTLTVYKNEPVISVLSEITKYEGMVEVIIQYPADMPPLRFPYLLGKRKGKLVGSLEESHIPSVLTLFELRHALKIGYEVKAVHWSYLAENKTKGIFKDYVSKAYRLKMQNDPVKDHPSAEQLNDENWCYEFLCANLENGNIKPVEDFDGSAGNYCEQLKEFYARKDEHGNRIEPSAGIRTLAKLLLNALYGKLGENPLKDETNFAFSMDEEILLLEKAKNGAVIYNHGTMTAIKAKGGDKVSGGYKDTSVILAAYTTAGARYKLWDIKHKLGDRLLYNDTDSVFYTVRQKLVGKEWVHDQWCPRDDYKFSVLGAWENDSAKPMDFFYCLAPKTYICGVHIKVPDLPEGLEIYTHTPQGKVLLKKDDWYPHILKGRFKGITLTERNMAIITYQRFKDQVELLTNPDHIPVLEEDAKGIETDFTRFDWRRHQNTIFIRHTVKNLHGSIRGLKGRLTKDGRLYPFGAERFPAWNDLDWAPLLKTNELKRKYNEDEEIVV